MATLTKEQYKKFSSNCANDWQFDWNYYVIHSEKILKKYIDIDEKHVITFELMYRDDYDSVEELRNGEAGVVATLWITPGIYEGEFVVSGIGKTIKLEARVKRKNFNHLKQLSKVWTDEKLMEKYKELYPEVCYEKRIV